MVALAPFLLLTLNVFSLVYANEDSTSEAVKWLEDGRSVLVYLATPDLNFWNQRDQIATNRPGAFLFNITLAPDNRTLLLNDEAILPRALPHVPPRLRAHQISANVTYFAHHNPPPPVVSRAPLMDLDYYIDTPDATSGASIYNPTYDPRVRIDILRATMPASSDPSSQRYSTPLASNLQDQIWVWLEDLSTYPPGTLYSSISLCIKRVSVSRRWFDSETQGTTTYKTLQSLRSCYIWSWLCADINEYPYYQFIYRESFDQYGKKGSLRHFVTASWAGLVGLVGFRVAVAMLSLCGSMVVLPTVYAIFKGVRSVFEMYRDRVQEVDEWLADEEVEGLLQDDAYLDEFGEFEEAEVDKGDVAEEKGDEGSGAEGPELLPSPPPYTPMKTETSLIS